jgi:predicted DNA-binding protein
MKEKQNKQNTLLHVKVTPKIHARLVRLAEEQGRTITELVREAIAKMLLEYSQKGGK